MSENVIIMTSLQMVAVEHNRNSNAKSTRKNHLELDEFRVSTIDQDAKNVTDQFKGIMNCIAIGKYKFYASRKYLITKIMQSTHGGIELIC